MSGFIQSKAVAVVYAYVRSRLEKTDTHVTFGVDEVYVVWQCYILGNWKVLVSMTLPDGMYYEVTFSNEKNEIYLDAYKKWDNVCISESDGNRIKTSFSITDPSG